MRITLRWEKAVTHHLIALLGCGGVCAVCIHSFWHYAAQFDDGAGEVRPLLLALFVGGVFLAGWMMALIRR